jgi:hypothetical protein
VYVTSYARRTVLSIRTHALRKHKHTHGHAQDVVVGFFASHERRVGKFASVAEQTSSATAPGAGGCLAVFMNTVPRLQFSTGASAPARECSSVIASAVERGDLWNARRRALAHCLRPPETDVQAPSFLTAARSAPPTPPAPPSFDDGCGRQCAGAWSSAVEKLFAQPGHLRRIRRTHRRHFRRLGGQWAARLTDCFAGGARAEGWEACCSTLRPLEQQSGHWPYATEGSNPNNPKPKPNPGRPLLVRHRGLEPRTSRPQDPRQSRLAADPGQVSFCYAHAHARASPWTGAPPAAPPLAAPCMTPRAVRWETRAAPSSACQHYGRSPCR